MCELGTKLVDRKTGEELPRAVMLKRSAAAEGWAWVDELYAAERTKLVAGGKHKNKARLAELNKGERKLFELQKVHGSGMPVAVTWNRGSGKSKGKVKDFPEFYLPAEIGRRRDAAQGQAYTFDLELEEPEPEPDPERAAA